MDARTSVAEVIEQMLVRAQVEVGIRAQHDDWSIADEHAATAITEVVLGVLVMRQPAPVPRPAPICVTTPPGEWHGLAARMVAEGLRARGWDALYLGCDSDPGDLWRRYDSARIALVVYLAPRVEAGKPPPRQIVGRGLAVDQEEGPVATARSDGRHGQLK